MAATAKTTNFDIPIYQNGDTVEFIPSYNNAMSIIDQQMQDNKSAAGTNTASIGTLQQSQQTMADQIEEITSQLPNVTKWEELPVSPNTQNGFASLTQAFLSKNILYLNGSLVATKSYDTYPVEITVNANILVPVMSLPGNIFSLPSGVTNFLFITCVEQNRIISSLSMHVGTDLYAWYTDNTTQLGFVKSANQATYGTIRIMGNAIPLTPIQNISTLQSKLLDE